MAVYAGGVAVDQRMIRHVARDHGACTDKGVTPDGDAAYNSGIGPDGCPLPYQRGAGFIHFAEACPGIPHIGKYHGRSAEDLIFQSYMPIYADIVLNLAAAADAYMGVDVDILADIAVFPNDGGTHDMAEVPDMCALANRGTVINNTAGMNECCHVKRPYPARAQVSAAMTSRCCFSSR